MVIIKLELPKVITLGLLWIFKAFTMVAIAFIFSQYSHTFASNTSTGYTIRILFSLGALVWIMRDLDLILIKKEAGK